MHPSNRAALMERVQDAISKSVLDTYRDNPHAEPVEIFELAADAVMEIIEPIANERDELKAKLEAEQASHFLTTIELGKARVDKADVDRLEAKYLSLFATCDEATRVNNDLKAKLEAAEEAILEADELITALEETNGDCDDCYIRGLGWSKEVLPAVQRAKEAKP